MQVTQSLHIYQYLTGIWEFLRQYNLVTNMFFLNMSPESAVD